MLVPVLSSHSAQTPKASLSPAFDLQCRKSGRGKFVPLSSGLSPHFGWQRDALSPPHQGESMPFLLSVQWSFPAGYFGSLLHPWHHEDLRLHQVPGAGSWQSSRSWDLRYAATWHTSNPSHCPSPAPPRMLTSEHLAS